MNPADIDREKMAQFARESEEYAERHALKAEFAKVILQGLVMSGRIDWENPNPDLLRCWRLASKAVMARDKAI
jgi:hypothetical protein